VLDEQLEQPVTETAPELIAIGGIGPLSTPKPRNTHQGTQNALSEKRVPANSPSLGNSAGALSIDLDLGLDLDRDAERQLRHTHR
jgi:hypothetical protein